MMDLEFANKGYLFLLLLIIPYILWYVMLRKKTEPTIRMADTFSLQRAQRSWRIKLMPTQALLRVAAFTFLILAMARPQIRNTWHDESIEGIDIMLTMDISPSMQAIDIKPNRIDAALKVASEFVSSRNNDNIGLTLFSGEAFSSCPLTIDHTTVLTQLRRAKNYMGHIADGTSIGMGIMTSLNRLKNSKAKSRIIILLTDGANNYGEISPQTAAETAKKLGIQIYTIGVCDGSTANYPVTVGGTTQYLQLPNELDEECLRQIAKTTNGKYYRATNIDELRNIYNEIDKLEKTKIDVQRFSKVEDKFQPFVIAAILALLLEILLRITIFRRIP